MVEFDRRHGHKSQPRSTIHKGTMSAEQLVEGVPVFSQTDAGVVQYIKINNTVYKNFLYKQEGEGGDVNLSDTGHVRLPGGMLMQWGVVGKPGHGSGYLSTTAKVIFPVAFPNKVLSLTATYVTTTDNTNGFGNLDSVNVGDASFGQVALRHPVKNTGCTFTCSDAADAIYYIAIGY